MKTKTGYKIITHAGNKLYGYCIGRDFTRRYRMNIFTSRHKSCGPLALFETLEDADHYLQEIGNFDPTIRSIYRCEYIPSKEQGLWAPGRWKKSDPLLPEYNTIFAEKIKLLRKVK